MNPSIYEHIINPPKKEPVSPIEERPDADSPEGLKLQFALWCQHDTTKKFLKVLDTARIEKLKFAQQIVHSHPQSALEYIKESRILNSVMYAVLTGIYTNNTQET